MALVEFSPVLAEVHRYIDQVRGSIGAAEFNLR